MTLFKNFFLNVNSGIIKIRMTTSISSEGKKIMKWTKLVIEQLDVKLP